MKFSAYELNQISRALALETERRLYRRHSAFTRGAWPIIEPGTTYRHNWHLEAISDHLEQVSAGNIKLLLINMPPRHMKSIGVSVTWCPWEWGPAVKAHVRFLHSSYAGSLSVRDSLKARRIIQSDWYQRLWPQVQLSGDQNAKLRFENSQSGYRLATSVSGLGTGEGGDRVVVDDPHNVQEAESEAVRESTVEWWSKSMSTRLNDPETGAHVIVMQRLNEMDVSGYELKERAQDFRSKVGECVHLMLPAEFETQRKCVTYVRGAKFFEDPRKKEGDLLWPERFTKRAVDVLKRKLGDYGSAGQLQQRPAPIGGGILRIKHLRLWPAKEPLPDVFHVVNSYDTAFTERTQNDATACTAWGAFKHKGTAGMLLLDCWTDYLGYPALKKRVMADWHSRYGGRDGDDLHPGRKPDAVLVEEKGSGISLLQDLRLAKVPAIPYNPGGADKIARAHTAAPLLEQGVFWVLESHKEPGKPIMWARPMLKQFEDFPNGEDDDLVDTFTQMSFYVRDRALVEVPEVDPDEVSEQDYHAVKRRPNPYGGG